MIPAINILSMLLLNFLLRRGGNYVSFDKNVDINIVHDYFMGIALEEARVAASKAEVPIGAVLVQRLESSPEKITYRILSKTGNRVERNYDASAHAEIRALREGARRLKNWRLLNTTLYSTLEPCPMCLSACQAFRLQKLVYGAPDIRLGAVESHIRLLDFLHPYHNISTVVKSIGAEESRNMLQKFFRHRRLQIKRRRKKEKQRFSLMKPRRVKEYLKES